MWRIGLVIFLIFPFDRALAQTTAMFSDESLQAIALEMLAEEETASVPPTKSYRPYWVTIGWLTASTIYDVETTFYRITRCVDQCIEGNPVVKPFIERGRLATYAYSAVVNGVVMYIAKRMYDRGHPWWRWIPITFSIVHGVAGTWNLVVAGREPT